MKKPNSVIIGMFAKQVAKNVKTEKDIPKALEDALKNRSKAMEKYDFESKTEKASLIACIKSKCGIKEDSKPTKDSVKKAEPKAKAKAEPKVKAKPTKETKKKYVLPDAINIKGEAQLIHDDEGHKIKATKDTKNIGILCGRSEEPHV